MKLSTQYTISLWILIIIFFVLDKFTEIKITMTDRLIPIACFLLLIKLQEIKEDLKEYVKIFFKYLDNKK